MDDTQKLILEALVLLLEAEKKRCYHELEEHRHPHVRQSLINEADKIELTLCAIDSLRNPSKEETDESGNGGDNPGEPGENQEQNEDTK